MSSTVELAKRLGIARIRKLDGSSGSKNINNKASSDEHGKQLKYVFVIDFESTCWAEKTNVPSPEIIEFPVLLFCLSTGKILSEFHSYCLPIEQSKLSPFCTELTGISQKMVEDGVPLSTCLVLFKQWLTEVCREYRISLNGENVANLNGNTNHATCCTWSDWDLKVCLEYECKRKQLRKPSCLNSWIDIRELYRDFYNRRPNGLNGALRELGLSFQGREHSGIVDARNTSQLIWKMVQSGCELRVTGSIGADNQADSKEINLDHASRPTQNKHIQPLNRKKWQNFTSRPRIVPSGVKIGPPSN